MDGTLIVRKWKLLGVAGLAGVAATGVVIVRAERRRQALSPDDVRVRLRQRYEAVESGAATPTPSPGATLAVPSAHRRRPWRLWRRTP